MKIERKGEIFLLISLSVRIVVIHLRRQKKTDVKMMNSVLHIILVVVLLIVGR